jgi:hypothetical protein
MRRYTGRRCRDMTKIQILTQQALERGFTPEQAKKAEALFRQMCPGQADLEVPEHELPAFKAKSLEAAAMTTEELVHRCRSMTQRN